MMTEKEFEELMEENSKGVEILITGDKTKMKGLAVELTVYLVEALLDVINSSKPRLSTALRCYAIESLQKTANTDEKAE